MDIAGNFIGAQQRGVYCILKMFAVSPWKICPRRKLNSAKLESRDYRVLHTRYTARLAQLEGYLSAGVGMPVPGEYQQVLGMREGGPN